MEFLTEEEHSFRSRLLEDGRRKAFAKGALIYQEGDLPEALYFVQTGLVGLMKSTSTGVESLLRVFKQGQFFGHRSLFSEEPYHAGSRALEPSEIVMVQKSSVIRLFDEEPRAYFFLARALAKELRRAENRSVMISEMQLKQRVASALLLFKKLNPDHLWTRTEIANYCASRTPTVIKTLSELEEQGIIKQDRRKIEILDEETLIDLIEAG